MTVVDLFLMPVRPGAADVWALGDMIELVELATQLHPRLTPRIVLNAMDRTQFARDVRASLRDVLNDVLNAELGYRIDYRESMGACEGPTLYKPNEKAAHEVRALLKELKALLTEEG
jgi:cellulose biosynthesis protein BcsQ